MLLIHDSIGPMPIPHTLVVKSHRIDLHCIISVRNSLSSCFRIFLRLHQTAALFPPVKLNLACIGAQLRICLSAKKLIAGHSKCFALNIPQCNINRADSTHHNAAISQPPKRGTMKLVPDLLVVHRIHPYDQFSKILCHSVSCVFRPPISQTHFAVSADTFIRIDTHNGRIPWRTLRRRPAQRDKDDVYTCYFHFFSLPLFKQQFFKIAFHCLCRQALPPALDFAG